VGDGVADGLLASLGCFAEPMFELREEHCNLKSIRGANESYFVQLALRVALPGVCQKRRTWGITGHECVSRFAIEKLPESVPYL
jgi:hypothetical protein